MYVIFAGELLPTSFLSYVTKTVLFSSITPCFKEYEKLVLIVTVFINTTTTHKFQVKNG